MNKETFKRLLEERNIPTEPGYYWYYSTAANYLKGIPEGIIEIESYRPFLEAHITAIFNPDNCHRLGISKLKVNPLNYYFHPEKIKFPKGGEEWKGN